MARNRSTSTDWVHCVFTVHDWSSVDLCVAPLLGVVDPVLELLLGVGLQLADVLHRHAEPLVRPAPNVLVEGQENLPALHSWLEDPMLLVKGSSDPTWDLSESLWIMEQLRPCICPGYTTRSCSGAASTTWTPRSPSCSTSSPASASTCAEMSRQIIITQDPLPDGMNEPSWIQVICNDNRNKKVASFCSPPSCANFAKEAFDLTTLCYSIHACSVIDAVFAQYLHRGPFISSAVTRIEYMRAEPISG